MVYIYNTGKDRLFLLCWKMFSLKMKLLYFIFLKINKIYLYSLIYLQKVIKKILIK